MDLPKPPSNSLKKLSGAMDYVASLGPRMRRPSYSDSHGKGASMLPVNVDATLRALHAINAMYQEVMFLQQIRDHGSYMEVLQNAHRIEWHQWGLACALLLWIEDESPIPMDNVHPEWDTPSPLRELLLQSPIFPHAVLWSPSLETELESPWQATHWWPTPGVTDAVDNPAAWLQWWWSTIMNEKSSPPSLQTILPQVIYPS